MFTKIRIEATSVLGWVGLYELEAYILSEDRDRDGLSNDEESEIYGTDPDDSDSDDDGINDSDEVALYGTNPLVVDTDGDGVSDYQEFAPTAYDDKSSTFQNTLIGIDVRLNDTDPNGDNLTIISVSDPEHGSAEIEGGGDHVKYTPDADFIGDDSFTYTVSDTSSLSASATVTITVSIDSTIYYSNDDNFGVEYNSTDNVALGKSVTSYITENLSACTTEDQPALCGASNLVDGSDATLAYPGATEFDYEVDLGGSFSLEAVWLNWGWYGNRDDGYVGISDWDLTGLTEGGLQVYLAHVEDNPQYGESLVVLGETLQSIEFTRLRIQGWSVGTAEQSASMIGIYELTATIPFVDSDGDGLSDYQETEIYNTNPDEPNYFPDAQDDAAEVVHSTATHETEAGIDVRKNDTDADGDYPLTIVSVTDPEHGSATFIDDDGIHLDHVIYTPDIDFVGTDSFIYTVADVDGLTDTATVTVMVTNQAPVANDDEATTNQNTKTGIDVRVNDTDADGDYPLTIVSVTDSEYGIVEIEGDHVTFTPDTDFIGTDWTITYHCTLMNSTTHDGDVTIQNNAVMTIPYGITLDLDFATHKLTVENGSGVLIEQGGGIL